MKEKMVISAKITKELYEKMSRSKDIYFETEQQTNTEIKNSWKEFIVMLYRNWAGGE